MKRWGCFRWGLTILGAILLVGVLLAAGIAVDNTRLPVRSSVTDHLPALEQARLQEALHLRQALGDQVLPGWASAKIPMIAYNEEYAFLLGYPPEQGLPETGWRTVPKNVQRGGPWEITPNDTFHEQPYLRSKLPASGETPQAFVDEVGGMMASSISTYEYTRVGMLKQMREGLPGFLTAIFPYRLMGGLLVDSSDKYISLVLHESAHAYQVMNAPERVAASEAANNRWGSSYPVEDAAFKQAWQAEIDTLIKALNASQGEERRALVRQFLRLRQERRAASGLSAEMIDFERQREWLEGMARYAELSIYLQGATAPAYQPIPAIRSDPDFHGYQNYPARWNQEIDQLGREAGAKDEERFYYTGAVQAYLLDQLSPAWKDRLFEEGVWLEDLLAEAVK